MFRTAWWPEKTLAPSRTPRWHDFFTMRYCMLDLDRHKVEAIFADPACTGTGIGKQLN